MTHWKNADGSEGSMRLAGPGNWVLYALGFCMVIVGLYMVRADKMASGSRQSPPQTADAATPEFMPEFPSVVDAVQMMPAVLPPVPAGLDLEHDLEEVHEPKELTVEVNART